MKNEFSTYVLASSMLVTGGLTQAKTSDLSDKIRQRVDERIQTGSVVTMSKICPEGSQNHTFYVSPKLSDAKKVELAQNELANYSNAHPLSKTQIRTVIFDSGWKMGEIVTMDRNKKLYAPTKPFTIDITDNFGCYNTTPYTFSFQKLNGINSEIDVTQEKGKVDEKDKGRLPVIAAWQMLDIGQKPFTYTPGSQALATDGMIAEGLSYLKETQTSVIQDPKNSTLQRLVENPDGYVGRFFTKTKEIITVPSKKKGGTKKTKNIVVETEEELKHEEPIPGGLERMKALAGTIAIIENIDTKDFKSWREAGVLEKRVKEASRIVLAMYGSNKKKTFAHRVSEAKARSANQIIPSTWRFLAELYPELLPKDYTHVGNPLTATLAKKLHLIMQWATFQKYPRVRAFIKENPYVIDELLIAGYNMSSDRLAQFLTKVLEENPGVTPDSILDKLRIYTYENIKPRKDTPAHRMENLDYRDKGKIIVSSIAWPEPTSQKKPSIEMILLLWLFQNKQGPIGTR